MPLRAWNWTIGNTPSTVDRPTGTGRVPRARCNRGMDIRLGEVTLYVRDSGGDGTPVLLLHGWPDTGDLWQHQVPALHAAGYRTIAPDLRGYGRSSKPTDLAAYTARTMAGDVIG